MEASRVSKGGRRGPTMAPGALWARLGVGPRQGAAWTPGGPPGCPPSPIYFLRPETLEDRTLLRDLSSVPLPPRLQDREHQKTSSRHPAEGRIDLREPLPPDGRSPADLSVVRP